MNPKWALATVPVAAPAPPPEKSKKQQEQAELYYALQANKKNNLRF